jgi:hypothetical protein
MTERAQSNIVVTWEAPWNGGAEITSYTVYFQQADEQFSADSSICDGPLDTRECTIPSERFTQAPFSLRWGASVFARVEATNVKGTSVVSLSGNGGIILRVPDKPVNLQNVAALTSDETIGLRWEESAENGGTVVIDYLLEYAEQSAEYQTLEVALTDVQYTAVSLTSGLTYKFRVKARNTFGYSDFSEEVLILAA